MLPDARRTEIAEEERYRRAVREELGKESGNHRRPLLEFLNSAFGLWLLSSVLIGGLSWGYTRWDAGRSSGIAARERVGRLDLEIPYRIGRVARFFAFADSQDVADVPSAELRFALPELGGRNALFPDYRDVPLYLLVFDLKWLVPEREQGRLDELLQASRQLFDLEIRLTDYTRDDTLQVSMNERTRAVSRFFNEVWPKIRDSKRYSLKP